VRHSVQGNRMGALQAVMPGLIPGIHPGARTPE
jgi:hypothetical protein